MQGLQPMGLHLSTLRFVCGTDARLKGRNSLDMRGLPERSDHPESESPPRLKTKKYMKFRRKRLREKAFD
jgi:hypothetical protein